MAKSPNTPDDPITGPPSGTLKVELLVKYWPASATGDNDALHAGTVVELPHDEAARACNLGVAKLAMPGDTSAA